MKETNSVAAIILAGGIGERTGLSIPKQFFRIKKRATIFYTLDQYLKAPFLSRIIVVSHPQYYQWLVRTIKKEYGKRSKCFEIIEGGATRRESIYRGLKATQQFHDKFVIVQDAVRPYISSSLIRNLYNKARTGVDGVIVCIKSGDLSVKVEKGSIIQVMNKQSTYLSQSPECYRIDLIVSLHEKTMNLKKYREYTNLELMVAHKQKVVMLYSEDFNQKITYRSDIDLYKKILY